MFLFIILFILFYFHLPPSSHSIRRPLTVKTPTKNEFIDFNCNKKWYFPLTSLSINYFWWNISRNEYIVCRVSCWVIKYFSAVNNGGGGFFNWRQRRAVILTDCLTNGWLLDDISKGDRQKLRKRIINRNVWGLKINKRIVCTTCRLYKNVLHPSILTTW